MMAFFVVDKINTYQLSVNAVSQVEENPGRTAHKRSMWYLQYNLVGGFNMSIFNLLCQCLKETINIYQ